MPEEIKTVVANAVNVSPVLSDTAIIVIVVCVTIIVLAVIFRKADFQVSRCKDGGISVIVDNPNEQASNSQNNTAEPSVDAADAKQSTAQA